MPNPVTTLLETPDGCARCFTGIDDDHDGNCGRCARLVDRDVAKLRIDKLALVAELVNQEVRGVIDLVPKSCRVIVREGAGPEDIFATLAVSVAKLASEYNHQKRILGGNHG
jgi:hypothetical protein